MTTAEYARIARDLWVKLGRPEMAWPSAAQLLAFMRQAPVHIAEGVAARLLQDQQSAARCFELHHPEIP